MSLLGDCPDGTLFRRPPLGNGQGRDPEPLELFLEWSHQDHSVSSEDHRGHLALILFQKGPLLLLFTWTGRLCGCRLLVSLHVYFGLLFGNLCRFLCRNLFHLNCDMHKIKLLQPFYWLIFWRLTEDCSLRNSEFCSQILEFLAKFLSFFGHFTWVFFNCALIQRRVVIFPKNQ